MHSCTCMCLLCISSEDMHQEKFGNSTSRKIQHNPILGTEPTKIPRDVNASLDTSRSGVSIFTARSSARGGVPDTARNAEEISELELKRAELLAKLNQIDDALLKKKEVVVKASRPLSQFPSTYRAQYSARPLVAKSSRGYINHTVPIGEGEVEVVGGTTTSRIAQTTGRIAAAMGGGEARGTEGSSTHRTLPPNSSRK
jgi:hypothetical protein